MTDAIWSLKAAMRRSWADRVIRTRELRTVANRRVCAVLGRIQPATDCHRLRPFCSTRLHDLLSEWTRCESRAVNGIRSRPVRRKHAGSGRRFVLVSLADRWNRRFSSGSQTTFWSLVRVQALRITPRFLTLMSVPHTTRMVASSNFASRTIASRRRGAGCARERNAQDLAATDRRPRSAHTGRVTRALYTRLLRGRRTSRRRALTGLPQPQRAGETSREYVRTPGRSSCGSRGARGFCAAVPTALSERIATVVEPLRFVATGEYSLIASIGSITWSE
jgi:hypothetical protein